MKVRETRSISYHIVFRLRETRFRKDKPCFPLAVNSIKSRCPSFPQRRTRTFLDSLSFPQRRTRTFLDSPSFPQRRTRSAGNSRRGTRCGELDIYPSRNTDRDINNLLLYNSQRDSDTHTPTHRYSPETHRSLPYKKTFYFFR